ncbi:hypothetical protein GCM10010236_09100 [Streptomyces eurythermus]|nr:hypothetical protein GCM10010236_09100 [Streptomyces eurythermus]
MAVDDVHGAVRRVAVPQDVDDLAQADGLSGVQRQRRQGALLRWSEGDSALDHRTSTGPRTMMVLVFVIFLAVRPVNEGGWSGTGGRSAVRCN